MDQTQAYLARVLPWTEYPDAYRNIHFKGTPLADGTTLMPGAACRTIEEAVGQASYYSSKHTDVFVCMALQAVAKTEARVINGRTIPPQAKRLKTNAVGSKAFWLDLDVKELGYASTEEVLKALMGFINITGFPRPTTITASGGGGIHAIWVTDRVVPPTEWSIIARALSRAANEHGMRNDANVTNDIVRILRVPGTFNSKYMPMTLCHTMGKINPLDIPLANIKQVLANYLPDNVVNFPTLPARAPLPADTSEFSAGVTLRSNEPIPMEKVEACCPLVEATLKDGGAKLSGGGSWSTMLLLTAFLEDGRKWAHELSKGHAEYQPAVTDAKYDEKLALRSRGTSGVGWPSCGAFSTALPGGPCGGCAHATKGKSPLHFLDAASPLATDLPFGYHQNGGGVWFTPPAKKDETGNDEIVTVRACEYQVADAWLDKSLDGAPQINFQFISRDNKNLGLITIPADRVTSQAIAPLIARQDFFIGPAEYRPFMEFVMSWMKQLQNATGSGSATPALGWVGSNAVPEGFAFDNCTFTTTGKERAARSDTVLLQPWAPHGSLDRWRDAAAFIVGQKRPGLEAILAASFAGPLVKFTGHKGLLASAYSPETGIGKTTAMSIAAAVWGHPTDSAQALDDTPLSSLKRLGAIRNLPFFWDEVRLSSQDKTDKLATLIFALTTGRERTRLNSNSTMQVAGTWQTMMVTASNQSILEIAREATKGSDAGSVRVFEWRVPPAVSSTVTSSEATRIAGAVLHNYGTAGLLYAEWLGKNHQRAKAVVEKLSDSLNLEVGAVPDERFWVSSMACLLAGATIARSMGLVDFDLAGLKQFCLDTLAELRQDRVTTPTIGADTMPRLTELLGMYLTEARHDRTLETSPGKPGSNFAVQIDSGAERIRTMDVHIDNGASMIYLRTAPFYLWLRDQGLQRKSVLEGLRLNAGASEQRMVMGAHTSFSTGARVSAICVPVGAVRVP